MFCSQCGKKVNDNMLFCPFCGAALVLPEQDTDNSAPEKVVPQEKKAVPSETVAFVAKEDFEPLDLDALAIGSANKPEVNASKERTSVPENDDDSPFRRPQSDSKTEEQPLREPVRLAGNVPDLKDVHTPFPSNKKSAQKRPSTYVPPRRFDPDDIFLDGEESFEEEEEEEEFTYEEPLEGGFFERHIRGMVGLMSFAVLLIVLLVWSLSDSGQRTLAGVNLAWRSETYAQIAYEAYESKNYARSAEYYLKALAREPESYNYAYYAGAMYLWNGDAQNAAEMAKRAVQIDDSREEAYQLLLQAYPDVSTRPWEIQQLLEQGYAKTGLESLKP